MSQPRKEVVKPLTNAEIIERLLPMVANGGSSRKAAKILEERGIQISETRLRHLRDKHSDIYQALAAEKAMAVEEAIAQEYREIIVAGQKVTRDSIAVLQDQLDAGTLEQPEKVVAVMAKTLQVASDKLLSITGRPVSGVSIDPSEAAKELIKLGVLKPIERPVIEGTAEDVDD